MFYSALYRRLSDDELPIVANVSRSGLPKATDQIGRGVNVTVTITNDGPSAIGQGRLTVYLPYRTPCTRNAFLLYLHSVSDALVAETSHHCCFDVTYVSIACT